MREGGRPPFVGERLFMQMPNRDMLTMVFRAHDELVLMHLDKVVVLKIGPDGLEVLDHN